MTTRRPPARRILLWAAMAAALASSWAHVAAAFGQLEHGGPPAWLRAGPASAILAAVGLDAGMLALAWVLAARRRLGQPARDLWAAAAAFAALSSWANMDAALRVVLQAAPTWPAIAQLDAWTLARVVALAAALPLLVLTLGRALEADAVLAQAEVDMFSTAAPDPQGAAPAPRSPWPSLREAAAGG